MTNKRVSVIQKARYGVLMIPVAWLLFSIWVVINEALPRYTLSAIPRTAPSGSETFNVVIYALATVWVIFKILQNIKNHVLVSAELKSAFAFLLGSTMMATKAYFPAWQVLSYTGIAFLDLAAIIVLVTLFQGKPFGPLTLYHKDVQIQKIAE